MPGQFTRLFGQPYPTYTAFLLLALAAALLLLLWGVPRGRRARLVDGMIGVLVAALVLGRAFHVVLQWAYFADNPEQIWLLNGLDWHGAFLGGMLGGLVLAHFRPVEGAHLMRRAAWIVPLVATAGWWGCAGHGCAYGAPLESLFDYPRWLTWEAADLFGIVEPRFATQRLGALLGLGVLAVIALLAWRQWLPQMRVWIALLLLSAGNFAIGFLRDDYALWIGSLRSDQWLDALTLLVALIAIGATIRRGQALGSPGDQSASIR